MDKVGWRVHKLGQITGKGEWTVNKLEDSVLDGHLGKPGSTVDNPALMDSVTLTCCTVDKFGWTVD